jgi:long-chain fatty acid transport protein
VRALVTALIVAGAYPAQASLFDTYGFGARAASMTGAHAAFADDYTGVFYNPATLTVRKRPHVGLGVDLVAPDLYITPDQTPSADAPPAGLPSANVGVHFGVLFPLGGLIEDRIALGIGAYLPTVQLTRVEALDPQTPQSYRYGALPDKIGVAVGAAFELHPAVSLGLGMHFLGGLDGTADVQLDLLTQRFTRKALEVDVQGTGGLTAGILVRPSDTLRLGLSFRDALQLTYRLLTRIDLIDVGLIEADVTGVALYTPQQYTLGASWQVVPSLTLVSDLVWSRWSQAPDPAAHFALTLDGEPLGLGSLEAETTPIDLGAVDTLEPRFGVEWQLGTWAARGGYTYRPTPLPAQTGFANYADSAAHVVGFGGGVRFADPLAMRQAPITLDLAAQLTWLTERHMHKSDDADLTGSYLFGGPIWHGSLTFRHDFY